MKTGLAEKPKASPLGLGIAVPDTHESPPRRAHRRGASAPLSPSHRAALACEGGRILRDGSRGGPGDFQLPRSYEAGDAGLTFRRTESLPSFAMHWDPTAEWTARSARMLATALIFIALVGWVALPSSRPQAQDAVQATLYEPVRRHSRPLGRLAASRVLAQAPSHPNIHVNLWQVLLHQTVPSLNLSAREQAWRESWQDLGFKLQTANDSECRADMERLALQTGQLDYLHVYDALETGVQRADMWRYSALYLYGGVYADVDVVAKPQMVELLNANPNRSGIVFVESMPTPWLIGFFARFLYVTDMVRVPQYRNCIMVARKGWGAMRLTLDNIVAKFKNPPALRPAEPTFTLELTGPGIFTDSIKACDDAAGLAKASSAIAAVGRPGGERVAWPQLRDASAEHLAQMGRLLDGEYLAGAGAMTHISRLAGNRYFTHMGQGSWKLWRHHGTELDGAAHHSTWLRLLLEAELDPHEVRLLLVLACAVVAAAAALVLTYSAAARLACALTLARLRRRLLAVRSRAAVVGRWMGKRAVKWAAVLVSVSGLRALCGARWFNPWRVVGFWLCLFESGLKKPPAPPAPILSKLAAQENLAVVVCCGPAIGARLAGGSVSEAIEQFGAHFNSYAVHLVAGRLLARDARDNTRQVLRAWAIRNRRVTLHLEDVDEAEAAPPRGGNTSLARGWVAAADAAAGAVGGRRRVESLNMARGMVPGGAAEGGRSEAGSAWSSLAAWGSLPAFVRASIPAHVGYVLIVDGDLPHAFYPEALLSAFEWAPRWDAVCANTMDADGELRLGGHAAQQPPGTFALGAREALMRAAAWTATATARVYKRVPVHGSAVPVSSCAEGVALYRRPALDACASLDSSAHAPPVGGERSSERSRRRRTAAGAAAGAGDDDDDNDNEEEEEEEEEEGGVEGGVEVGVEVGAAAGAGAIGGGGVGVPAGTCERRSLHRCMASHGFGRYFILPSLAIRHSSFSLDVQYVFLTILLLLPATMPCLFFCLRFLGCRRQVPGRDGVAGWWRLAPRLTSTSAAAPHRGRCVFLAVMLVVCVQVYVVWRLHAATSAGHDAAAPAGALSSARSAAPDKLSGPLWTAAQAPVLVDSPAILLVPLLLPGITAIDLVADRRSGGSLGERVATAALTVLTPLFWLLELRRLQAASLPERVPPNESPANAAALQQSWEDLVAPCQ
jgi:hypothetical protein